MKEYLMSWNDNPGIALSEKAIYSSIKKINIYYFTILKG